MFQHLTLRAPAHALTLAIPPNRPTHTHHHTRRHYCKMFDEDKSGKIDEDEFFFLLQYLGIEVGGAVRFCR